MHLGISLVEVLEVAHAISHSHGIKRAVGKAQIQAVAGLKGNSVGKPGISHLAPCHTQHSFRKVDAHNSLLGLEHTVKQQGKVAGTRSHVENVLRLRFAEHAHSLSAPQAVDSERHGAVHEVVSRCNRVKHLSHLPRLAVGVVIGLY